ncbi:SDR family NAD(P)-dependent oxidoreductase [Sphingomonas oligophenolica]|uniref:SDR family NAD(P)-dependent oxidoreductase n=1 Tax=Sphingomonas oligophenolica TaxID=301154 RepID=A0ABU9XXH0_9SPHN
MSGNPPVALVTGASRGAGRGIAVALGSHGCTVYVTGRSETSGDSSVPGTIHETAAAVTAAGGTGIAVRVDHADDSQVTALFERISADQGRLDILVNNACAIHDQLSAPGHFWEKPLAIGDMIDVGLRSGFVAGWYAAPSMVAQRRGLIVFTSAPGSVHYVFGPAYGAHKAGVDKMAHDMSIDLREANVAAVSIWMGSLATERLLAMIDADPARYGHLAESLETPEFTGHVIWALYSDPELMALSGKTLIGAEIGAHYGIVDRGGKVPPSVRATHGIAPRPFYPNVIR